VESQASFWSFGTFSGASASFVNSLGALDSGVTTKRNPDRAGQMVDLLLVTFGFLP
jgi:hypothetical protein